MTIAGNNLLRRALPVGRDGVCADAGYLPAPRSRQAEAISDRERPSIAVVAPSLEILGGQGVQAALLCEQLRTDGWRVLFIPINPCFPRGLRWLRRVPYARTVVNELLYLPGLRALRDADVVHVFSASYWSFLLSPLPAMLVARLLGKRVVLNYHSGEAEDHLGRWGYLVHPWLGLAHEIVVPSHYLSRVFARHRRYTRVIGNVLDTQRFRFRPRYPLRPWLLSTRNLEPHYGVRTIIEAFALLKRRYPGAMLTIAGYGSEERKLRQLVTDMGLEGVHFAGRVEPELMPELYASADIFVNASVVDNQPLSILEAFAAGLPVVSTGTGDIAAMVRTWETGIIVPAGDPAAIAGAITKLLQHPYRSAHIARRARAVAETYTWPGVREDWSAVYTGAAACG